MTHLIIKHRKSR